MGLYSRPYYSSHKTQSSVLWIFRAGDAVAAVHGGQHVRVHTVREDDAPLSLLSRKGRRDVHVRHLAPAGRGETADAGRQHHVRPDGVPHGVPVHTRLQVVAVRCLAARSRHPPSNDGQHCPERPGGRADDLPEANGRSPGDPVTPCTARLPID